MSFHEVLRSLRQANGLSQGELGQLLGMSQRHLSFLETGRAKPSRDYVLRIIEELGMAYADGVRLLKLAGYGPTSPPPCGQPDEIPDSFFDVAERLVLLDPIAPSYLMDDRLRVIRMNGSMGWRLSAYANRREFYDGRYLSFPIVQMHPEGILGAETEDAEKAGAIFLQFLLREKLRNPVGLTPIVEKVLRFPLSASSKGRIEPGGVKEDFVFESNTPLGTVRRRHRMIEVDHSAGHAQERVPRLYLVTAIAADERSECIMKQLAKEAERHIHPKLRQYVVSPDSVVHENEKEPLERMSA